MADPRGHSSGTEVGAYCGVLPVCSMIGWAAVVGGRAMVAGGWLGPGNKKKDLFTFSLFLIFEKVFPSFLFVI